MAKISVPRPEIDIRLREAARAKGCNLDAPENAFTVWYTGCNNLQFCGARSDLTSAYELAREHVRLTGMYVLHADPSKYAHPVPDDDRVPAR